MKNLNGIGRHLKALRKKRDVTQKEVAAAIGAAPSTYALYESEKRELGFSTLVATADYYSVSCDYLLRGIETKNVDVCNRTSLAQETLDALERYADRDSTEVDFGRRSDCGFPARRFVINALLQDSEFINQLTKCAVNAFVAKRKEALIQKSASQYLAGIAFANFFNKLIADLESNAVPSAYREKGESHE